VKHIEQEIIQDVHESREVEFVTGIPFQTSDSMLKKEGAHALARGQIIN